VIVKGSGGKMRMIDTSLVVLFGAVAVEAMPIVKIRSCYDGDTCRTSTGRKIRLDCIDPPESLNHTLWFGFWYSLCVHKRFKSVLFL
jgi:endonuclease YncB( thermonuclease family)